MRLNNRKIVALIAACLAIFWQWEPRRKRRIVVLVVVLTGLAIYWQWEPLLYYRFDSRTWLSVKPERRYFMARYLIEKGGIQNWTREQVLERLGPGEKQRGTSAIEYDLGPERSLFMLDGMLLTIRFDAEGHVVSVGIRVT